MDAWSLVALVASVLVGAAFVVAGASKLAAGDAWPVQADGMGAPAWSVRLVPWVELVVGAGLAARLAPVWFGLAALVLLGAFSWLIARRLAEGRRPPCACFGAWSAAPLGSGHLLRNGALALLALASMLDLG